MPQHSCLHPSCHSCGGTLRDLHRGDSFMWCWSVGASLSAYCSLTCYTTYCTGCFPLSCSASSTGSHRQLSCHPHHCDFCNMDGHLESRTRGYLDKQALRMNHSANFWVRKIYELMNSGGCNELACSNIWNCSPPKKCKIFACLLVKRRIKVRVVLKNKDLSKMTPAPLAAATKKQFPTRL